MIVVADALIIYSVYNSDVMYKRERNLYKYLHKKKQMSALKNNMKRGRYPVIKNPSRDKVKRGRSNETKLWGNTHQGSTLHLQASICSYTAPNSQATPQRCQVFHKQV